jgi:hypothetical protein
MDEHTTVAEAPQPKPRFGTKAHWELALAKAEAEMNARLGEAVRQGNYQAETGSIHARACGHLKGLIDSILLYGIEDEA